METTDLKTLEDLDDVSCDTVNYHLDTCYKKDLREEAIKWAKHFRDLDSHCPKCMIQDGRTQTDFMHFFNITDEDLK